MTNFSVGFWLARLKASSVSELPRSRNGWSLIRKWKCWQKTTRAEEGGIATKRHKSHKTFCDFCAFLWLIPHELNQLLHAVCHFIIRKALHEEPSVGLRAEPVIQHCKNAAIRG